MTKHNGVDADVVIHALSQWYLDLLDDLEEGSGLEVGVRDQLRNSIKLVREYEAKAKAFDEIFEKYEGVMKEVRNRKFKVTGDVTLLGLEVEKVIKKYESGEYDAKK